jgi:hypothetical protein
MPGNSATAFPQHKFGALSADRLHADGKFRILDFERVCVFKRNRGQSLEVQSGIRSGKEVECRL